MVFKIWLLLGLTWCYAEVSCPLDIVHTYSSCGTYSIKYPSWNSICNLWDTKILSIMFLTWSMWKLLFGLLCSFNEGRTIFTIPMLRFCCLGSWRLRCLWFLMGLSHPLHAQSSPTQCAAAQDESPRPNAQGLCWTEDLTLPEVTCNAEWIDLLPRPWLSESICTEEL